MGFRIKISDKLNRKTKKWNSIVLIDFFVSRQEFIQKIFKRTLQGCYKVVWMKIERVLLKEHQQKSYNLFSYKKKIKSIKFEFIMLLSWKKLQNNV